MKSIKLTKKESDKILGNMRKGSINPKTKRIKEIKFHKEFEKGMRLYLCKNCGYPCMFMGMPMVMCECKKPNKKIYALQDFEKFISDLQKIFFQTIKNRKLNWTKKDIVEDDLRCDINNQIRVFARPIQHSTIKRK